jgi:hypothetical protein
MTTLTKNQVKTYGPKQFRILGDKGLFRITAEVRYDDRCGNGRNSFAITGTITRNSHYYSGGCLHQEIAKHFPELAPFIKFHLFDTTGPMHYVANACYLAGDRDHNGLLAGEFKQIRNGRTGQLCWRLKAKHSDVSNIIDADEKPAPVTFEYEPVGHVGEGKARDLDGARRIACWPDATDEELMADDLKDKLLARLPALLVEFRAAVESLGFTY